MAWAQPTSCSRPGTFETDPTLGRQTRERITRELEDPQTVAANNHYSNSVFGRVLPGTGKRWTTVT
jgi:hypothetical protein